MILANVFFSFFFCFCFASFLIYYLLPFALDTYYNETNQEIELKARESQEAIDVYKEGFLLLITSKLLINL